jgi:hypothetical protein
MRVLAFSIILTFVSLAVHLLAWRIAIPRRQTRALLAIFALVPCVVAATGAFAPTLLRALGPVSPWEWLHVVLFYVAVTLAYIVVYSALEERSPSMTLLSHAAQAPATGCSRAELEIVLGRASPVEVRLAALVRDGLVDEHLGVCRLTRKGRRLTATFECLRQFLGFGRGG